MKPDFQYLLYLSAFLFSTGLAIVIIKRHAIMVLIGIELMLNACNLNLVAFSKTSSPASDGRMFALFVIIVAVCETAVGLAIILQAYRHYTTPVPDEIHDLKEKP